MHKESTKSNILWELKHMICTDVTVRSSKGVINVLILGLNPEIMNIITVSD